MEAFEHFGGAPREILYDRMKTAVLGDSAAKDALVIAVLNDIVAKRAPGTMSAAAGAATRAASSAG